jgi:hypothetical protein
VSGAGSSFLNGRYEINDTFEGSTRWINGPYSLYQTTDNQWYMSNLQRLGTPSNELHYYRSIVTTSLPSLPPLFGMQCRFSRHILHTANHSLLVYRLIGWTTVALGLTPAPSLSLCDKQSVDGSIRPIPQSLTSSILYSTYNTFTPTPSTDRNNGAVCHATNGIILLAGGVDHNGVALSTVDIYDPSLQKWLVLLYMSTLLRSNDQKIV